MHEVTDMYFVAALISYGADYIGVDRADKRNQKFNFNEPIDIDTIYIFDRKLKSVEAMLDPTFDEIKKAFDTLTLLYPANYPETIRRVKGIIHT